MMTDLVADMLTRIKNGQKAKLPVVRAPYSGFSAKILQVMQDEGYIKGFEVKNIRKGVDELAISLKYLPGRKPVIVQIKKISKSGKREFVTVDKLGSFFNGLGIAILSTSKGVVSSVEAQKLHVGGELICKIF